MLDVALGGRHRTEELANIPNIIATFQANSESSLFSNLVFSENTKIS